MRHDSIDPGRYPFPESGPSVEGICVQDRMSRPAVTIPARGSIDRALRLMAHCRIHYLPVVDDQAQLVGIVNADDLHGTRRGHRPSTDAVEAVMSAPVVIVGPRVFLKDAMRMMAERGVGALPVLDEGRIVGVLTQSDVVVALAREAR